MGGTTEAQREAKRHEDGKIDVAARKTHLLAFARNYLDMMTPAAPGDDRPESDPTGLTDPSVPPTRAQGPPH